MGFLCLYKLGSKERRSLLRSIAFLKGEHALGFLYLCDLGSKGRHKATTCNFFF